MGTMRGCDGAVWGRTDVLPPETTDQAWRWAWCLGSVS
jgi:hypothetical protein